MYQALKDSEAGEQINNIIMVLLECSDDSVVMV